MRKSVSSILIIFSLLLLLFPVPQALAARGDTVFVTVPGTLRYDYAQRILELVNIERVNNGLSPLTLNKSLTRQAMQRAADLVINFSHTRPNGNTFSGVDKFYLNGEVIDNRDGPDEVVYPAGENITAGHETPEEAVEGWMNSPSHRFNILTPTFESIGIGCFVNNGIHYWVQLFGRIPDEPETSLDAVPADIGVETELGLLQLSARPADDVPVDIGETISLTNLYNSNVGYNGMPAVLLPKISEIKDASEEIVATAVYGERGSGSVKVTGVKEGTGTMTLAAYEGQLDAPTLQISVTDPAISYDINVYDTDYGSFSVSHTSASYGTEVMITVSPNNGSELNFIHVFNENSMELEVTQVSNSRYTFKMPRGEVYIKASFIRPSDSEQEPKPQPEPKPEPETETELKPEPDPSPLVFADVPSRAYYYDAVKWALEKSIASGISTTTFSPDASCTRAQMVTFLWRANGSPVVNYAMKFTDVPADAYYAEAVRWAVSENITSGISETAFAPDMTVTRSQTVTFLYRAAGAPAVSGGSFADVDANAYYADAVAWAVAEDITSGTSETTFSPDAPCTRGQIVTFLYRDVA